MLYFSLILILVQTIKALSCSNYYDYTGDTVMCTATCPANSKLVTNKCLNNNQYLMEQQVHYCYQGWVDSQNSICCPQSYYISINKNVPTCLKCSTRVYLKGMLCCPASQYADLTNQNRPTCTSLGTGTCSGIAIKNLFQVCCPSGQFYSLQQQICVNPASYNCNSPERVCCRQGHKLDSSNGQLICVPTCGWNDKNNFICRKKQCNNYGQSLEASMTLYNLQNWPKLSFTSICSYGLNTNGSPVNDPALCMKRFLNRGWAVCCQSGEFYSIKNNQCSLSCDGIILFQFFCIQQGSILNLQAANGQPAQSPSGSLCNNKRVSNIYPVCCPSGFYINGTNGCELCNGRVFTSTTNQICCGYDQTYNSATDRCQQCNGIVNRQGTLCCLAGQYFSYSTSGDATCVDSCVEGKIYKADYCCDSLTNSCQNSGYQPTLCSPSYFIEGACQACPTFCTLSTQTAQICAIGVVDQCKKICQQGTIYSTEIQQCLACDPSCQECSQPFDPQYCINCKQGYVYNQGQCNRCAPQCFTCTIGINTCTSCSQNSSRPVLINGRCAPDCQVKKYYQISTASCSYCASNCIQCTGSSQIQCSKCPNSTILNSGTCSQCSTGCITCFFTSNQCFRCQNNYVLDTSNQCVASCRSGYFRYYEPSLGHSICHICHPSCASCINQAQNCVSCSNSSYFINGQAGLNLCTSCNSPCLTCSSASTCLSCQSGYYFQNSTCLKCDPTCQTCISGSNTGCLSCFGTSQLISGRCVGCSSSCFKCDLNQNCEICQPQIYIYNGNCVQECPQRSYKSQKSCINCLTNCSTCAENKTCTSCSSSHPIFFNNLCLKICPQGYKLQNGICIVNNNNNNNNNTDNNNNTQNNTNNNKTLIKIIQQQIQISSQNSYMIVMTTLQNLNQNSSLSFYLYNTKTAQKIKLKSFKMTSTQAHLLSSSNNKNLTYNVSLPSEVASMRDNILITAIDNNFNSSTYYNTKSISSFILYDYTTHPLMGLQYVGLSFTILILIYALISKLKGHFIAEQANTIILHMLNFIQVVYLFKYTQLHTQGMYHFLNGFGFMHLLMFPNFFYNSIPKGYVQYPGEKSSIPDGNFIRNAGSSISFLLISLVIMLVACVVSYMIYRGKDLFEMPQIRKITRIGILAIQITFLNIVFTALNYIIQPFVTTDAGFANSSRVAAFIMFIIILIAMVGIFFHFYKTYNSDVLQHYYTLREGCHYLIIVCQAFIFTFAIGKPLLCLFLIPLQIIWFAFNYMLYRYGQGDKITQHAKFIVSTVCVIIAYLFLSLSGQVNWILIVIIVSIVVVILIVYSSYQIIGLYYALIFRNQVKSEQGMKIKQSKGQGTDKQSAYKV